jgi:hypothetical protein
MRPGPHHDRNGGHPEMGTMERISFKLPALRRGARALFHSPTTTQFLSCVVTACRADGPGWPGLRGAWDPSRPKMQRQLGALLSCNAARL